MDSNRRYYNVLFIGTANSACSIIAEAAMRQAGGSRFRSFSAGSRPSGHVSAYALDYLRANHLPVGGLRSKSWNEFARDGAPELDFVITVGGSEVCPAWPGDPVTANWAVPDPAAVDGTDEERRKAFFDAGRVLLNRVRLFASLPLAALDRPNLARMLAEIRKSVLSDDPSTLR